MSKRLFFQGNGDCVVDGSNGYPPIVFSGRILWVPSDDVELADHIAGNGREEILESDPRYALAVEKGNLLRCTIKSAGLD